MNLNLRTKPYAIFSSNADGNRSKHDTVRTATDTIQTNSRRDLAIRDEPHVARCLGMAR